MNRPTFDQTIAILVKAYLNDELCHKICAACAVGNLVAHALGTKPKKAPDTYCVEFENNEFEDGTPAFHWYDSLNGMISIEGEEQIKATGYTIEQIRAIESAFENAPGDPDPTSGLYRGRCVDPVWMFNGLMAVVEVLAEIHGVDLKTKESAKLQFVKP